LTNVSYILNLVLIFHQQLFKLPLLKVGFVIPKCSR